MLKLRTHRHLWGAVGPDGLFPDVPSFVSAAGRHGYDAVEVPLQLFEADPQLMGSRAEFDRAVEEAGLAVVPIVATFGSTVPDHLSTFRRACAQASEVSPPLVVAHVGRDAFDDSVSEDFLADCLRVADDLGVQVAFETHRGRILFHPWRTLTLLERLDGLWLNADFAHFVCVAERLLARDQVMLDIARRCLHAHHRVGYENGPQVPDPRDPTWERQRVVHEQWWDAIWRAAEERGDAVTSMTPEYGPATFAPLGMSAQSLWDICEWTTDRSRARFSSGAWRGALTSV